MLMKLFSCDMMNIGSQRDQIFLGWFGGEVKMGLGIVFLVNYTNKRSNILSFNLIFVII
jgi:hypothetical protein